MAPSTANVITSTSPNIQSGDLGVQVVIGSLSISCHLSVIHSHVYSSLVRLESTVFICTVPRIRSRLTIAVIVATRPGSATGAKRTFISLARASFI